MINKILTMTRLINKINTSKNQKYKNRHKKL